MKRKVTQNELKYLQTAGGELGEIANLFHAQTFGLIPRPELDTSPLTDVEFDFPEDYPLPASLSKDSGLLDER